MRKLITLDLGLLTFSFLIGALALFFGIKNSYYQHLKSKDFIHIQATLIRKETYSSDEDSNSYRLIYSYTVNNKTYEIATNYGTAITPKIGSEKNIKYNPKHPGQAVITGYSENTMLIIWGISFMLITKTIGKRLFIDGYLKLYHTSLGLFMTLFGVLIYYTIYTTRETLSLSLNKEFNPPGIWLTIPILFIVLGLYSIIHCQFKPTKKLINRLDKK